MNIELRTRGYLEVNNHRPSHEQGLLYILVCIHYIYIGSAGVGLGIDIDEWVTMAASTSLISFSTCCIEL